MATQVDMRSLAEVAQQITLDLGKLATGLTAAGADPGPVQRLHQMAEMMGGLATALGHGPVGGAQALPGGAGPEAGGAPGPGGPPAPGGAAPGGPPPGAPAPGGPPTPGPATGPPAFHEAAAGLQAKLATAHAAAQRQLAGQ